MLGRAAGASTTGSVVLAACDEALSRTMSVFVSVVNSTIGLVGGPYGRLFSETIGSANSPCRYLWINSCTDRWS
jgi:hypothetical protein